VVGRDEDFETFQPMPQASFYAKLRATCDDETEVGHTEKIQALLKLASNMLP
jgi:hypothetical protein